MEIKAINIGFGYWECSPCCLVLQIHNSTENQVVLKSVNLSSTGRYRCEVSAEAPSFQTVSDHGDMTVVGE
jgi:hypothetical protein